MTGDDCDALLILTNLPDRESALRLARTLVERRLAACVNVLGGCTSIYRWQGNMETAEEVPLFIKTRQALYGEVEAAIRSLHPYELPEIVAVSVVRGLSGYLAWLAAETTIAIG
jgi:periplasmic divalent cation tolerance protein